jgi:hypothetical protein
VSKRFVQLRGKDVTLRTWTEGAADADYTSDKVLTAADTTVKAVKGESRLDRTIRNEAGEDIMADASFFVEDGNEPSIPAAGQAPQIIDEDGNTYEVTTVRRKLIGVRELLCERVR